MIVPQVSGRDLEAKNHLEGHIPPRPNRLEELLQIFIVMRINLLPFKAGFAGTEPPTF